MAWHISLGVECGASAVAARAVAAHFHGYSIVMGDGRHLECSARAGSDASNGPDCEGNWWAAVFPGISTHGDVELRTAERISEVGGALYRRLEGAPSFRWATFGVEAHDWRHYSELDQWCLANVRGLVVSEEIWARLGSPSECVSFRPGYMWKPYAGEKQGI